MEDKYKPVFSSLVSTIRAASGVAGQDISFYRQLDKTLDKSASKASAELLSLANDIMQVVAPGELDDLNVNDSTALDDHWNDVSHVLDTLSERIDAALSQHRRGDIKEAEPETNEKKPLTLSDGTNGDGSSAGNLERISKHLAKPQEKFSRPVDNSPNKPFKPLLTSKPHAIRSFEESTALTQPAGEDVLTLPYYPQPYDLEISEQEYPKSVWNIVDPQPSQPWTSTKVIYVDNQKALNSMVEQLKKAKEIAVDLEHHDYRSFYGIVCLMQISDRENDFIVDTLVLRDELEILNTVFADPSIIKVFHGASMDIIWLQRDFGLYVVSLFDTYHAARSLGLKRHGLAYLLEMYANFQTSKKYQLADWRIRPIPNEMMSYAQSDTHFLLNIYDQLKNELIQRGEEKQTDKLEHVLSESRLTARQRYEIPGYDSTAKQQQNPFASSWTSIAYKYNLNPSQKISLKALYDWRDEIARKEDESPRYIMPNHIMVALSTGMPTDSQGVFGLSSSSGSKVRVYVKSILEVIKAAKTKIEAFEAAGGEDGEQEDESPSSSSKDVVSIDIEHLEDNYEKYQAEFLKARTKQSMLFSQNPEKLAKKTSSFWGATISQSAKSAITIEHLDGLLLLNDDVEVSGVESESEEDNEEEQAPILPAEPKNVVYMGQSGTISKVNMEESVKDLDADVEMADDDTKVTLTSFGSSGTVLSKSAKQRARKQKKKMSLAAAVSEESKKRAHPSTGDSNAGDDDDESPAKKVRGESADIPVVAFDYNSAPSVLNRAREEEEAAKKAKRNNNKNKKGPNDKPGPFNPYGAQEDGGIRGPRKKKLPAGVGAGRSGTFKATKKR